MTTPHGWLTRTLAELPACVTSLGVRAVLEDRDDERPNILPQLRATFAGGTYEYTFTTGTHDDPPAYFAEAFDAVYLIDDDLRTETAAFLHLLPVDDEFVTVTRAVLVPTERPLGFFGVDPLPAAEVEFCRLLMAEVQRIQPGSGRVFHVIRRTNGRLALAESE